MSEDPYEEAELHVRRAVEQLGKGNTAAAHVHATLAVALSNMAQANVLNLHLDGMRGAINEIGS